MGPPFLSGASSSEIADAGTAATAVADTAAVTNSRRESSIAPSLSTEMISRNVGLYSFIFGLPSRIEGRARAPAAPQSGCLALLLQVEGADDFIALAGSEVPLLSVMVRIDEGEYDALHVSRLRGGNVCTVDEIERQRFAVGRGAGFHARLITGFAVMGHQKAVAIQVEHGDHVVRLAVHFADDLAHHG